jgi:putative phosphoesterase
MRIGVVSDTHNNLRNVTRIVELLNEARVDRVVHTGDITQPKTLEIFGGLDAPLFGVYGNNDERSSLLDVAGRLGMRLVDGPLHVEWASRRIVVVHDPLDLSPAMRSEHSIALHGHNHRCIVERVEGRLTFNPGECAGHMAGQNAIGLVDLDDLSTELLRF